MLVFSCGVEDNSKICPQAKCSDYATQQQAQTAFDADPDCKQALDNDNDQIACEELSSGGNTGGGSSGGSGCPTTSNCGCSNINKSQCGGSCCQWIVGTGCRCR
jgi:hypothetical protein